MKVKRYIGGDEVRCVQSSFRMIIDALLDIDPGKDSADSMTGYVEGRGTWQFRMLLAFANYGLNSIDRENLDIETFLNDPKSAIFSQAQDEATALGIIEETDFESEQAALRACLASDRIRFIQSIPDMDDLIKESATGRLVMVSVNRAVLRGVSGRDGHILIIEEILDDSLVVHDPGTDGGLNKTVERSLFERAWKSPSIEMCNFISVWKA